MSPCNPEMFALFWKPWTAVSLTALVSSISLEIIVVIRCESWYQQVFGERLQGASFIIKCKLLEVYTLETFWLLLDIVS